MNEADLLSLLKEGNPDAFSILYNMYWKRVYNFSRLYISNRYTAEEIVQDVFVKIWESRSIIRENDNFKGLLFIITRNMVFNAYRKSINSELYKINMLAALDQSCNSVEQEVETNSLSAYIESLIEKMPPRRKEIFNLSRKEQKSHKEIAEQLNISEKTIENQISEALKYLKKNMTEVLYSFLFL